MAENPMVTFGSLLRGCISDDYAEKEGKMLLEGVAFILLGLAASVLTTYALASFGFLV